MDIKFDRFKRHKLGDVFKDENAFNDWLAENINVLNQVFTVDFVTEGREASKEGLRVDILASFNILEDDNIQNNIAIIEVQRNESDSKHLGQLITYGEQHKAQYCIWIAESFRPGHLKAISVLNDIGVDNNRYYFPVVVEFLSIGNSNKVINFRIESEDLEQPFSSVEDNKEKGDQLWSFYDNIRVNLQEYNWFTRGKSTKDRNYQFTVGLPNNHHVYALYGWVFRGKDEYMLRIDIRKLDFDDDPSIRKSKEFTNKLSEYIREIYKDEVIEIEMKDERKHDRIYLKYPQKISVTDLSDINKKKRVTDWSIQKMIDFQENTFDKMNELANSILQ